MKLLDARVNGMPRQVKTKYGDKAVLDVATSDGNFTIWSNPDNREVMGRMNGERVSISTCKVLQVIHSYLLNMDYSNGWKWLDRSYCIHYASMVL